MDMDHMPETLEDPVSKGRDIGTMMICLDKEKAPLSKLDGKISGS